MKALKVSAVLVILLFPIFSFAQEKVSTAGFLSGNIWYSKEDLISGDKVNVYTLIFNSALGELTGTVEFYDGDKIIGKTDIVVPGSGGSKVAFTSWTVTEGYHKVFAVLKNSKLGVGSGSTVVSLEYAKTAESEKFVSAKAVPESATSTVKRLLEDKINLAEDYASQNLPEPVVKTITSAGNKLEGAREEALLWIDKKSDELNIKIEDIKNKESENKNNTEFLAKAEKPLVYAYALIVKLVGYIFESAVFFYGVIFIGFFFLIRFIKRIFFF